MVEGHTVGAAPLAANCGAMGGEEEEEAEIGEDMVFGDGEVSDRLGGRRGGLKNSGGRTPGRLGSFVEFGECENGE